MQGEECSLLLVPPSAKYRICLCVPLELEETRSLTSEAALG